MTRITQQNLESYLWGAAVLLRGTIDAGDYKQFIFPLLFYKRLCDVFDEETVTALRESGGDQDFALFPENHRFQVPADAHWREIRKVSRDVGRGLQQAMRAIETANPDKLFGIFGDAQWTNKDRLSDAMLRDLIEHFSTLELTVANLPEDELGQGYEYLIKKFADDSGHTAAEFYTNRTVVHLMTEMLDVQPGESVYDPTCGSGGMLLSCVTHLRRQGKEWRNVKLYGQERNMMTSSIARMNCFLHGIEDFRIERGDTLAEPKLVDGDRLQRFDVVLANPPYSIKQWNREAFAADPWGRNVFGVPPQGRADYAFQQHILQSLKPKSGRCAVLWPHGVLFRKEEADMRRKLIEADLIDGLWVADGKDGPDLALCGPSHLDPAILPVVAAAAVVAVPVRRMAIRMSVAVCSAVSCSSLPVAVCKRKLTGTSICRSLEFFIHAFPREHVQIMNPFTKLTGIVQDSVIEFHLQIDTGSPRTIIGFANLAAEPDIEFH